MVAATEPKLTVLAWGNTARGDDGVGPILGDRLIELGLPGVTVIEDMQLQIEHTTDFEGADLILFIDASVALDEGFSLNPVLPADDFSVTTHSVSPAALLKLYETSTGKHAPDAWILEVAAESFELGDPPSEICQASIEAAWSFLDRLLKLRPETRWRMLSKSRSLHKAHRKAMAAEASVT